MKPIGFLLTFLTLYFQVTSSFDLLTAGVAAGFGIVGKYVYDVGFSNKCWFGIKFNVTEFEEQFDAKVFGQHIVKDVVSRVLKSHLSKCKSAGGPKKALVISMHGWTGSGKNHVSKIIAESLYEGGLNSPHVHSFVSTYHFPHDNKIQEYKTQLRDWVRGNTSQCAQSMFIFDESDSMPYGLLDVLKPFMDHHEHIDGVDYRKNIFIFTSNVGGREISQLALEFYLSNRRREDIKYEDLEKSVLMETLNEKGVLKNSQLITKSLIDLYVPFLPLTREIIAKCAEAEAAFIGVTLPPQKRQEIVSRLVYWPEDAQVFSATGCKRVSQLLDLVLDS